MTYLNPDGIAGSWELQTWSMRARASVLLLSVHGFITKSQSEDAYDRILAWENESSKVVEKKE